MLYAGPDYRVLCSLEEPPEYAPQAYWEINGIGLSQAMNFSKGSQNIIVGVLDTGIDGTHPELENKILDSMCRDFTSGEEVSVIPVDPVGHGTHVAGIISAIGNYNSGNGFKSNVSLVSLRVLDENKRGYSSSFAMAISYAERNNIKILNLSAGWFNSWEENDFALDTIINDYSGLVVCAAGNNSLDNDGSNPIYPASYICDNIISVGSYNSRLNKSDFSNYGENSVDIYAPGSYIYSTVPGGGYDFDSGTSMAAPYVTCVAALLLSVNPNLSVEQLKNSLLIDADIITITIPNTRTGTNESTTLTQSVKKLNAYNSMKYVLSNFCSSTTLDGTSHTLNGYINSYSSYFNENNYFIKLNVSTSNNYYFNISSSNELNVIFYDSNFNEITLDNIYVNSNINKKYYGNLTDEECYLRISFLDEYLSGAVNISIEEHVHQYTESYFWLNSTKHSAFCSCGDAKMFGHVVLSGTTTCLLCGGKAEMGFVGFERNLSIIFITEQGSCVLPNGVIILVPEDFEAFINGSLTLYS